MNHDSGMLQNREARQFFKVTSEIERAQSEIFVLENVLGILRVEPTIMEHLRATGNYDVRDIILDPLTVGCSSTRKRVYFMGERRDVLRKGDEAQLEVLAEDVLKATHVRV